MLDELNKAPSKITGHNEAGIFVRLIRQSGFDGITPEMRAIDTKAVPFYLSCGCGARTNYGKCTSSTNAACFTKNCRASGSRQQPGPASRDCPRRRDDMTGYDKES